MNQQSTSLPRLYCRQKYLTQLLVMTTDEVGPAGSSDLAIRTRTRAESIVKTKDGGVFE